MAILKGTTNNNNNDDDDDYDGIPSEIPLESNYEKRKRAAIQEVMKDKSLNPTERNGRH